jgi:CBS-domain-containing membrane protein
MKVRDLMRSDVLTTRPDESLKDVARALVENRISGMPVCDADGRVVGVVSEGDILLKERGRPEQRAAPLGWLLDGGSRTDLKKATARTAGDAMTTPAITVRPSSSATGAARRMIEHGVNRLPVVTQDERLIGIVTRADLVRAFSRSDAEIATEIQKDIVQRVLWAEPSAIEIVVREGEVQVAGELETRTDVEMFERLVEKVPGVVSVQSTVTARITNGDGERSRR